MSSRLSVNGIRLNALNRILKRVNQYKQYMASLSDYDLQALTATFKARLAQGETLDDVLPEAFAAMREANKRVLGMFAYDVQVLGGIALHQGNIAEMRTGEGKTLTATLPLYLNALTGKGVMLVTTNDYLTRRDGTEMGEALKWMGLTVAIGVPENEDTKLLPEEKRAIYACDVVYTTNHTLGFDYLMENLATSPDKKFLRPFNYVIIDEVDSVLLDSAQTPLIISGAPRVQSNFYTIADQFVSSLSEDVDYALDEERTNVWLTSKGIEEAQHFFGIEDLFASEHHQLIRHIILALKAYTLFERDKHYVIEDGKLELLDQKSGRVMRGTKLQAGQHQAMETKEQAELTPETRSMASVTYQNLFKLFDKMSGMTGTGKVADKEFNDTYGVVVVTIPTNKPVIRVDKPDIIYATLPEKLLASMAYIVEKHRRGQPLLIVTGSVAMSDIYSKLLLKERIAHNVLNAYNTAKEAAIIAEAGQYGAVTVATAIAGRGTDIKLGEGVAELGGLVVVGTERMESRRVDLQIRGRSGRQGDPGGSQFFLSLEDPLLVKWGPNWLAAKINKIQQLGEKRQGYMAPLKSLKYKRLFNQAQEASDSSSQIQRRQAVELDESVQVQRNLVYSKREQLLSQGTLSDFVPETYLTELLDVFWTQYGSNLDVETANKFVYENISYRFKGFDSSMVFCDKANFYKVVNQLFKDELAIKETAFNTQEEYLNFIRMGILKAIDTAWVEQVDYLQQFRVLVMSRQSAQRNPVYEYHEEAYHSYEKMREVVRRDIVRNLSLSILSRNKKGDMVAYFP